MLRSQASVVSRRDPARPARPRGRRGAGAVIEVLRSRPPLARPARPGLRGGVRGAGRRAARARRLLRHRGAAPRAARGRRRPRATRSSRRRSRSWRSANSILYERARPVFVDIDPVTLNLDVDAAAAAITRAHDRAAAGPHLRLPGRHAGAGAPRAADRRGRLRGARRGPRRRRAGRRPRPSRRVRLLRQQAAHHGRGRDAHAGLAPSTRSAWTPSATRAARPTWAGSTTTGSASTTG